MRWFQRFFRREPTEKHLDAELRFHLEQRTADLVATGVAPEEARRRTRLEFGGIDQVKEECRDVGAGRLVEALIQDIRFGLRRMRRNPGFAAVAVTTLAIGVGASIAIFSVVEGVLLEPLPYSHPEQLVSIWQTVRVAGLNGPQPLGPSNYLVYRAQSRTFQDIGLYRNDSDNVTGVGEPERVRELEVTDGTLPILGVPPMLGRWFNRQDVSPGSPQTVMLTYGYWQQKFGGSHQVVGRTLELDGESYQIIGVMPKRFHFLDEQDPALILPIRLDPVHTYLGQFDFNGIARLKPGVTITQANADVARMNPIVLRSFPPPPGFSLELLKKAQIGPDLRPLREEVVGDVSKLRWLLMGGSWMVLLIACANVGNLFLVRTECRQQELAMRAALGATRTRIVADLFSESLVVGLIGSALGLGFAYGALRMLVVMAPSGLPRLRDIGIDAHVLLFTLSVALLVTLLFGSVPVLNYVRGLLGVGLHERRRTPAHAGWGRHQARNLLVTGQVALALVLLVCSGLMIRTFIALTEVNPGVTCPDQLQTFRVHIPDTDVPRSLNVLHMQLEIFQKIAAIPGVSSMGFASYVPMDGETLRRQVWVKDRGYALGELPPMTRLVPVSPGYFQTMEIPLIAGRSLTWSDVYNTAQVALVSEKFSREYWRDPTNAVGKWIRVSNTNTWSKVIGVVGDVHYDGIGQPACSCVFWPLHASSEVAFVIRISRAGSQALLSDVRRAVGSVDPNLPLGAVHTMSDFCDRSVARVSFTLVMLGIGGWLALLLAIVGLYGVVAYSVSRPIHEIGIRMALGAERDDVVKLVIAQGSEFTLMGVTAGVLGGLAVTRYLSSLLFGVKPTDPLTFIAASLILTTVALLASYIPAQRATKVDPMVALRHE